MNRQEIDELLPYLTVDEREEVFALLAADTAIWRPLPGPQTMAYYSEADIVGFGGAAGGGKGLALDTPLATPDGWTTMGKIAQGDTLYAPDGSICHVTAVSDISNRDCYRLTFDDGSVLVADDVHRWITFDARELAALTRLDPEWRAARRAKRPSRAKPGTSPARIASLRKHNAAIGEAATLSAPTGTMRDTLELSETLRTASGRANHAISVCEPLTAPDVMLPVAPYTLGAWLGDGSSRNGQITGEDTEVFDRIEQDGYQVKHYAWDRLAHNVYGLKVRLRDLGVLENKHIPQAYLRASLDQRLALLQGLMDTDGYAAPDGGCEFDGTNERLVRGVYELVTSLGIKATVQVGKAKLNGRTISDKWRVKFVTSLPVFGLPRKLCRLKSVQRRTTRFRYLVSCEKIDSVPTRCIAVDSLTRMYLAGKALIPTHNTDLACGLALTKHRTTAIFRENGTELTGVTDRLRTLVPGITFDRLSVARFDTPDANPRQIELGSFPNVGDETKYQGRPHDLIVYDETANMREYAVRFLMGWLRTTIPGQRCRVLMCFNPPTSAEGRWIIDYFAPWLDSKHPKPAVPGELRFFATIEGKDFEVPDKRQFVLVDGMPEYDFDPAKFRPEEIVIPLSRTFIPSRVSDNPHLMNTGYVSALQALPEPLRSQMLNGDFKAGIQDDPWQVIPTAWVEAAQARWIDLPQKPPMDSLGIDVSRGGQDKTILYRRHGAWFDRALAYEKGETDSGPKVAALSIGAARDGATMHIDVIGVGASPYDFLLNARQHVIGVNVAEKATATDKSGRLRFFNLRSQLWWQFRELLDPENNTGVMLPPDPQLLADLTAPRWKLSGETIQVESRDAIVDRIKRSPDYASAIILAQMDTPKLETARLLGGAMSAMGGYEGLRNGGRQDYDPYVNMNGGRNGY